MNKTPKRKAARKASTEIVSAYEEYEETDLTVRGRRTHKPVECPIGKTICTIDKALATFRRTYTCPHFVEEVIVEGDQLEVKCSRKAVRDAQGYWLTEEESKGKPLMGRVKTTRYTIALGKS